MDNITNVEKERIYTKNENSNQAIRIVVFNLLFLLSSVILTLLLHTVNFLVNLINIVNNNVFSLITLIAIAVTFYYVFKFVKKFPYIKSKNYLIFCLPVVILFIALVWVLFFILYIKDVKNIFFLPKFDNFAVLNNINGSWKILPIIYTAVSIGILAITSLFTRHCPFCQRSGLGIASKRIYTITKITREHVETKKQPIYLNEEELALDAEITNDAESKNKEEKPKKKKKVKPIDFNYIVYYQDFEYRNYRHYCSICGRILFEDSAKIKVGKKHLIADFTDFEKEENDKKINEHNDNFTTKEENLINKIYKVKKNNTPTEIEENNETPTIETETTKE